MDTTLGKSDELQCRCCSKNFSDDQLQSLFEYTNDEMELYKILMLLAPVSISRNDGFSQKICSSCRNEAMCAYRFRQMCISTDESVRSKRKPLVTNNEHDYSTWNINDYDMDLSEYLIDTKEETIQDSLLPEPVEIHQTPAIDETQNFDAPATVKKARRYACPVCAKLWVTPSKLKRHMSVHRNEKPAKELDILEAKKSEFTSLTFYELPKKEPEVQCPICFLVIESQSKLPQHMTVHIKAPDRIKPSDSQPIPTAQKIGKRYICTVCESEMTTPAKLQSHMKSKHMLKVIKHESNETKRRPLTFQNKNYKQRNVCSFCSKTFPNSSSLKRHITVHLHPKKTARRQRTRKHICQYCEKRFETPSKVKRHQSVHRDLLQAMKRQNIESSPVLVISAVTNILGD